MSHFKDLGFNESQYENEISFWEQNYAFIRELILEIDKDIYNGWGLIWGDKEYINLGDSDLRSQRIELRFGSSEKMRIIGISTSTKDKLVRIVSYDDQTWHHPKIIEVTIDDIVSTLRSIIAGFIDRGLNDELRDMPYYKEEIKFSNEPLPSKLIAFYKDKKIDLFTLPPGKCLYLHYPEATRRDCLYRNWYPDNAKIVWFFHNMIKKGIKFSSCKGKVS